MKKILAGILAGILGATTVGIFTTYGLAQSGVIDFAADEPHSEPVAGLIAWARERSIARASSDVAVANNLSDPERIRRGAGNYDAMCAQCHLGPGLEDSEIHKGLYPAPPNLSIVNKGLESERGAARRFWIIKHGIKGSGMPAWSKGGMDDAAIWDMVAFVNILPGLSPEVYRSLVATSDGHSHAGLGSHDELEIAPRHSAHSHSHSPADHAREHR